MLELFNVELIIAIGALMVLTNRFVEGFITPLFDKFGWNKFWLIYVAWILSGAFVFASGMNVFSEMIPNQLLGQIITALLGGGGANIFHDLTDRE
jgi:hypothetical protein